MTFILLASCVRAVFVNVHFTTKKIPAVAPGIIDKGLSLPEVFKIPMAALKQ